MSHLLGDRLGTIRGSAGLSQTQMGKLFGMSQSAYQRIEAGKKRHQKTTWDRIDKGVLTAIEDGTLAGVEWRQGMAAELDRGDLSGVILERLDRIDDRVDLAINLLQRHAADREIVVRLRALLDGLHPSEC